MEENINQVIYSKSEFKGGLLDLFTINIVFYLITLFTIGLGYPFAYCMREKWLADRSYINGRQLKFIGTVSDIFIKLIKWSLLSIITLGIYSFWLSLNKYKWKIENTVYADCDKSAPGSCFDGDVLNFTIVTIVSFLITLLTLGIGYPYAIVYKKRWFEYHTIINGRRLKFTGTGSELIGKYLLWLVLSVVTLGIYSLWLRMNITKWNAKHKELLNPDFNQVIDNETILKIKESNSQIKEFFIKYKKAIVIVILSAVLIITPLNIYKVLSSDTMIYETVTITRNNQQIQVKKLVEYKESTLGNNLVVDIPNDVVIIGKGVFRDSLIEEIIIPISVTIIEEEAFRGCTELKTITLPSRLSVIGDRAFSDCHLIESITIPGFLDIIGEEAFSDCHNLQTVTLISGVEEIKNNAFIRCSSLNSITIPDSVTSIGSGAFESCTDLESIQLPSGLSEIKSETFSSCTSLKSIVIPNNVSVIRNNAFTNCLELTSVTLPECLEIIEESVFEKCSKLSSIEIPETTVMIGNKVFSECESLESIILPAYVTLGEEVFDSCDSITIYCKEESLPISWPENWNGSSVNNVVWGYTG